MKNVKNCLLIRMVRKKYYIWMFCTSEGPTCYGHDGNAEFVRQAC